MSQEINYLKVMPGGHCYYCHQDYPDSHNWEECKKVNEANYHVPCDERCKDSKYYRVEEKSPWWPRLGPGIISEPPLKRLDW